VSTSSILRITVSASDVKITSVSHTAQLQLPLKRMCHGGSAILNSRPLIVKLGEKKKRYENIERLDGKKEY